VNVADYLGRVYPAPGCWLLVSDVYATELSQPVDEFRTVNASVRAIARAFRLALHKGLRGLDQIAEPAELCVVLLGKNERLGLHHCGIYTGGKLLHWQESGVYYEEMSVIGDRYALMEFWAPAP